MGDRVIADERVEVAPGVRLYVERRPGEPAGSSFVLVHGLASNLRLWDGVAEDLHARGHTVVALDQRGHGRSDAPEGGYDLATAAGPARPRRPLAAGPPPARERTDGSVEPRLARPRHLQILPSLWEHRPSTRFPTLATPALLILADSGDAARTAAKRRAEALA